ncbi:unnamed protein product [Sphagnum balticum]
MGLFFDVWFSIDTSNTSSSLLDSTFNYFNGSLSVSEELVSAPFIQMTLISNNALPVLPKGYMIIQQSGNVSSPVNHAFNYTIYIYEEPGNSTPTTIIQLGSFISYATIFQDEILGMQWIAWTTNETINSSSEVTAYMAPFQQPQIGVCNPPPPPPPTSPINDNSSQMFFQLSVYDQHSQQRSTLIIDILVPLLFTVSLLAALCTIMVCCTCIRRRRRRALQVIPLTTSPTTRIVLTTESVGLGKFTLSSSKTAKLNGLIRLP